jgi:colanic acid biosynthesis glycosyl transferase WcaI
LTHARHSILVLNQYYAPGVESTAQLLTELCEALARDYDVTVITGTVERAPHPETVVRGGVRVVRVGSTAYDRSRLSLRALNYLSFSGLALRAGLRQLRPDLVLCMSDPPFVSSLGAAVARKHGVPLVVVTQDVFPEIAVELGRLDNRVLIGVLGRLVRFGLRQADAVVAIGETMRRRLEVKGVPRERIRIIPNWTDTDALVPNPRANAWAREHDLAGRFVVMHSGNVGYAQDLESLVRAATFLRDLDDLTILIIGSGARGADLKRLTERLEVDCVRFLPYQPRERLGESLSAAHVHAVGLAHGLSGFVVPSRFYGVMAVGRPAIVHADPETETARIVDSVGCGVVVSPGRPELLAHAIRKAHDGEVDLERMGALARDYAVGEARRDVATGRYAALVGELVEAAA